jgi:hypothetical protein
MMPGEKSRTSPRLYQDLRGGAVAYPSRPTGDSYEPGASKVICSERDRLVRIDGSGLQRGKLGIRL